MTCRRYVADIAALIGALTDPDRLAAYQSALAEEMPSLADRGMAAHLRRMAGIAAQVQAGGLDAVDAAAGDGLLTDVFAVSLWRGWPLPAADAGDCPQPPAEAARGLRGADRSRDGAGLWLLADGGIAFARTRAVDPAEVEQRGFAH